MVHLGVSQFSADDSKCDGYWSKMTLVLNPPDELAQSFSRPPNCQHGPTLLFKIKNHERESETTSYYYYYACSASREHQFCSFQLSAQKWKRLCKRIPKNGEDRSRQASYEYLLDNLSLLSGYCLNCCRLLMDPSSKNVLAQHWQSNHAKCRNKIDKIHLEKLLLQPSRLLKHETKNENLAQYFFSDRTIRFVMDNIIDKFNFDQIICLGCPTIHEQLMAKKCTDVQFSSILLDIDPRYRQFYGKNTFIQFNMFNSYFFESDGETCLMKFLQNDIDRNPSTHILILADPPFGGLIECLAGSLKKIKQLLPNQQTTVSTVLFFPYFNEHWIRKAFGEENITITDFIVTYENHSKYLDSIDSIANSPVRIFTNLTLGNFVQFNPKLYRWCPKCNRTIFFNNCHCNHCKQCSTRDATKPSRHCLECRRCVKITSKHCAVCQRCHIANKCCKK